MERKNIRIRRDEILRLTFLKNEYKRIILKSISKTRSLKPLIRFYAYTNIQKKHSFLSRWKNFCLITGRARGTYNKFNLSRHMINKMGQFGYLTGFTRNNRR